MEIYTSSSYKSNLSRWQIKKLKAKLQKSYNLADSIKKISFYLRRWEEKRAEKILEDKLKEL